MRQLTMSKVGYCGGDCRGAACTACVRREALRETERERLEREHDSARWQHSYDPSELAWV